MPPPALARALPTDDDVAVPERLTSLVAEGGLELPILAEAAARVLALTERESTDAKEVADALRSDASVASHVLRLANSPLYRPSSPIVSLQQAIARLGLAKIRSIALTVSCQTRVFAVRGYEKEVKLGFAHALATGLYAQEIARARRWNVEEAFLCGLLHDIGKPVLLQAVVDLQRKLAVVADRRAVLDATERLHAGVGHDLAARWALPARVAETIRFHHQPTTAPTCQNTAMMTSLADALADLALASDDELAGVVARVAAHPMLVPLNVYPDEVEALTKARERVRESVESAR